ANNEVGTIQPLAECTEVVRATAPSAVLHTDAVQAFPWLDVASLASGADLVAVSAHKFGGPKGVGALIVREGTSIEPIIHGVRRLGLHERRGGAVARAHRHGCVDGGGQRRPAPVAGRHQY